jgi:octaheme c-type cytochrome (tetrathionate reductase family)
MKAYRNWWILGAIATALVILIPVFFFLPKPEVARDNPSAGLPVHPAHTDHTGLFETALTTGPEVTQACLSCHPEAADDVMHTSHWTWESGPYTLAGHDEPVYGGKKNLLNNFCISINANWPPCTACHAGYGWEDENYDFSVKSNVDCLVCHDTTGSYVKKNAGYPADTVDLVAVAESVGIPDRDNCGGCHFTGGGGDAVKHGDLDNSLLNPTGDLDVHMGEYDMICTDCHRTEKHDIAGRSITVSMDNTNQVYCTDCHAKEPHEDARINDHTDTVACQTCHIPAFARKEATKTEWYWSEAGQDLPEDPHEYLKIKGRFVYDKEVIPTYGWYSGTADRYILGDTIDPTQPTVMNLPHGDISDAQSLIFPFKVHTADQIYDTVNNYLLAPKTAGEGGFWTDFDWDQAARLGSETSGLQYSGNYDFAPTEMYWPITHMVAPAEDAVQCEECHTLEGAPGRLDWEALGYPGDPMYFGGRSRMLDPKTASVSKSESEEVQP